MRVVTDAAVPVEPTATRPSAWQRRRTLVGQALELSAQLVRPGTAPDQPGRIRQVAALAATFLPHSIESRRSIWSIHSMYSAGSVYSLGSLGSLASAGSAGSVLSIGSMGSILSIGSVGSVLSIGSAGSVLSIGGFGRRGAHWADSPEGRATVRHLGAVAGVIAVARAVASA